METKDFTPEWLKRTPLSSRSSDEIEVVFDDEPTASELKDWLETHQEVKPKIKRWSKAQLQKKKQSLLRQIAREENRIAEEHILRGECIELGQKLQSLRSHRTSVGFPTSG